MLNEMYKAIDNNIDEILHSGIQSYKTTRFFFVYLFRLIFEIDTAGNEFLENPKAFYEKNKAKNFSSIFGKLFCVVAPDFNFLIGDLEKKAGFFDYKNELRNSDWVDEIANKLLSEYKKSINRHIEDSFSYILSASE
jgi:hypothetical protein